MLLMKVMRMKMTTNEMIEWHQWIQMKKLGMKCMFVQRQRAPCVGMMMSQREMREFSESQTKGAEANCDLTGTIAL